jgi:hypothetical protein
MSRLALQLPAVLVGQRTDRARMKMVGFPASVVSATLLAPERQITRLARAKADSMSSMKDHDAQARVCCAGWCSGCGVGARGCGLEGGYDRSTYHFGLKICSCWRNGIARTWRPDGFTLRLCSAPYLQGHDVRLIPALFAQTELRSDDFSCRRAADHTFTTIIPLSPWHLARRWFTGSDSIQGIPHGSAFSKNLDFHPPKISFVGVTT